MQLQCLVLAAILALATAQSGCPNVTVQTNFDIPAYTGRWFEIERVPTIFEPNGACVTATYVPQNDTVYPVYVFNRLLNTDLGEYDSISGGARPADDSGDGKLKVKFPTTPVEANYWVLETDYENFSLVYSCNVILGVTTRSSWILSRNITLDAASSERVEAAIIANGIDRESYQLTAQGGNCVYV